MVPEPTEAMGAKLIDALDDYGLEFSELWRDLDAEGQIAQAQAWLVEAFAAAPPEWLLRAALTEEEVHWLVFALEQLFPGSSAPMLQAASYASVSGKLSRALRGGEEKK